MTCSEAIRTSVGSAVATTGITIYGCEPDEAALFREMAPRFGVVPTLTDARIRRHHRPGTRQPMHQRRPQDADHQRDTSALSRAGVAYISTRSVGYNHIDVEYAAGVGICVENVAYSPDSVADYTLMLMLMAVRNASRHPPRGRS